MSAVEVPHRIDGREDAPVLLLSNSLGSTMEMWQPQVERLSGDFRIVRHDTRGHGAAPVPPGPYGLDDLGADVLALMDRLGLDRVHFAGLSLGGMVGMWMAVNAPERIDRLALLCTSAMLSNDHDWAARAAAVRADGTGAVAGAVVERWFTPAFRAANPEVTDRMRAMIAATPAEGYAGCCGAIERMDFLADLPAVTAPTLVIAGAEDPATPPRHAEQIASLIDGARLEVVPGAAHLANFERPDVVSELLREHLLGARSSEAA